MLNHHATGNFRLARRILSRLKTALEKDRAGSQEPSFWALPIPGRWPHVSQKYVLIALKSSHEHVLQSGAAGWQKDEEVSGCGTCSLEFSFIRRKHHCRSCGRVVCDGCSQNREYLAKPALNPDEPAPENAADGLDGICTLQRICDGCKLDFAGLEHSESLAFMSSMAH